MIPNINYNEKGQRSDIHYGNGCKTRYEYDKNTFRLIRLFTNRNDNNNDENVLQDIHYTYDPVGNIVEIVDNAQQYHYFSNSVIEPRAMYKYDALYRLIEATGREKSGLANAFTNTDMGIDFPIPHNGINSMENYTHFYAYDKLGNIMSMNSQGKWLRNYVYTAESNLLLKHDSQQTIDDYAYDAHGNITRMPGIEDMRWNYTDYLSKAQCGTVNTWYVYDQSGNRSRKITEKQGGIREERIYLGSYEIYRKYQGAELVIERSTVHIMDDKSRVAIVDRQTVENGIAVSGTVNYRYQLSNHLDSATLELDQTAQIISYEEYHPFGTTSYWSGQSESEVKKKRYRYVGKERDEETGLYYYGARYYAAWIGRFVSVDPLKEERQWVSPYNYCQNNPINRTDRTGALDGWVESVVGKIYWDENATSQATTKKGEKYLGKNVLVGTHNRDASGNELINSAIFDLYLESNKSGPSGTIKGNTVPSDITKYGTLAEGLYTARFQGRASYIAKGKEDLALIINEGKAVPTLNGNPSKANSDMLTGVFFHSGNPYQESLRDRAGNPVWSHGCQTSGCGSGSKDLHNAFMQKVGNDFKGAYYLRAKPQSVQNSFNLQMPILTLPVDNTYVAPRAIFKR